MEWIPGIGALFISLFFAFFGLYICSKDKMFAKTKQQIVEQFVVDANKMSMKEIKTITTMKMMFIISTQSLHYLLLGGFITGSGLAVTINLGVWSMTFAEVN